MRRARKDEEKQERRQAILDTAWNAFREADYDAVTVAGIAERLGLAKGTVYLYFETKEALFLAVQTQQLNTWFEALEGGLQRLDGADDADAVAALIGDSLAAHPGLTRLLGLLHGVLERNISYDQALDFKRFLKDRLLRAGQLLEGALRFLRPGQGAVLLLHIYAFVIGVQQQSDPVPVVREVLAQPELRLFEIDFSKALAAAIRLLILGLRAENHTQEDERS